MHVLCGQETVEVSTFRGGGAGEDEDQVHDEHGRILRDNVFGTQAEDAIRRDFTINALFYDPPTQQILDYCGGFADLRKRVIRMIGEPEERYREDPVRMLRAVRLASKVGGHIEPRSREPIRALAELMQNVPPSRLFEEMLKLLLSGHATDCLLQLRSEGLRHGLLPMLDVILEQPLGERFVMLALEQDGRAGARGEARVAGFSVRGAAVARSAGRLEEAGEEEGMKPIPALHQAMEEVIAVQVEKLAIPRRYTADMKEMWALQPRLLTVPGAVRTGCSSTRACAPATISWRCAARAARWNSRWWSGGRSSACGRGGARSACCCPTRPAASAGAAAGARRRGQGEEQASAGDELSADPVS